MKTIEQIRAELDAKIPRDAVSSREQAGRSLSYLEGWYVIDRLNKVLGQGNWSYRITAMQCVFQGQVEQRSGPVHATSYLAQIELNVRVGSLTNMTKVTFGEVGYGDGTDKTNPGKAHELGAKEAVTDGLKRAAKNLGMSMGLALYDKTQEFVDDEAGPATPVARSNESRGPALAASSAPSSVASVSGPDTTKAPSREVLKRAYTVLSAQKKIDAEAFKTKYLNGKKIADSDDATIAAALKRLGTDFPETGVA